MATFTRHGLALGLLLSVCAGKTTAQQTLAVVIPDGPLLLRASEDLEISPRQPPQPSARTPAIPQPAETPLQLRLSVDSLSAQREKDRVAPYEVVLNGANSGTWLLLQRDGEFYAPRDAFEEWRVQVPAETAAVTFRGQQYLPMSAVPGYRARLNPANQAVELLFSPEAFAATQLTQTAMKRPAVSPVLPSFFFNYDLNFTGQSLRDAGSTEDLGLVTELGFSTGLGVLTNTGVGRNLTNDTSLGLKRSWARLETTFTKDFPDRNHTLRLGDTISQGGMLGRDFYFGGFQYGTNFALTPGFISQPLPIFRGLSAAPSTVELYVNDVLRQVSRVPTGPFAVGDFPQMTGGGEARLVVRDVLGRESITVLPFFTSARLLAAGLNDWRVEGGAPRRNLGTDSSNYDQGFVAGTWRHGYSDSLTLEGRVETSKDLQTLWLGFASALPGQLLGRVGVIGSQDQTAGGGSQWLLGLERISSRSTLQVQVKEASREFRQLALQDGVLPSKQEIAGNWSFNTVNAGIFGLGFASIDRFDAGTVSTVSANYTIRIGPRASLTASANHAVAGPNASSIGLTLILPLGGYRIATVNAGVRDGQNDLYATVSDSPAGDAGLGWRLLAGQQFGQERAEAGAFYTGRYGRVSSEMSTSRDQSALRLGAQGGMVLTDGRFFATRRVDQSFALVEVPGYKDISIGLGGNMLTRTDENGVALVPRLFAYQNNSVRVDPNELPISAELDSIEQVAVPAWRSAVKVVFPVRSGRGALLRIVFDDGDAAPAGAIAKIKGDKEEFFVARRGEAFVTGLQTTNRVVLTWKDRQCEFDVTLPPENPDEIPRVGPLLCKGVAR